MDQSRFETLAAGDTCYAHIGTSYRRCTVVDTNRRTGCVWVACPALGAHRGMLLRSIPRAKVDLRPRKPVPSAAAETAALAAKLAARSRPSKHV